MIFSLSFYSLCSKIKMFFCIFSFSQGLCAEFSRSENLLYISGYLWPHKQIENSYPTYIWCWGSNSVTILLYGLQKNELGLFCMKLHWATLEIVFMSQRKGKTKTFLTLTISIIEMFQSLMMIKDQKWNPTQAKAKFMYILCTFEAWQL